MPGGFGSAKIKFMDPRVISGLFWILFALFLIVEGALEALKGGQEGAWVYVGLGALILLYQFWLYRRTGKIGGPL